ncbi:DNA polymerase-3 subunit delta' [Clostridium collagenovorans DSM 3089]|uniref:DNA polymerase III subunit delta' n=1 Tax=Clostridium collagenovorans DSM 3089 TaxID=1121306 RepID=A0A1M5WK53_9CLOT|nr:DNA polymerase III subunit delta' [Clostridium collagenovorans]SHH87812.1 DNA polymerase-3 subunit delta' [Clostridium collagenovorans DSM 3089]
MKGIIGHKSLVSSIYKAIDTGRLSHAHLFIGEDGIGKSIIADELALRILGKKEDLEYADLVKFKVAKDKKSLGVDEVRQLISEISKKPYEGDKKVVIIYEAHKMTVEAQNAFLKTVEEPPQGVFIILLSESSEQILDTIKSRCQIHNLRALSGEEIRQYIYRNYPDKSDDEISMLIAYSKGIPGEVDRFLNDSKFMSVRDISKRIILLVGNRDVDSFIEYIGILEKYTAYSEELLSCILSYLRDGIIYKETSNLDLVINRDSIDSIKDIASTLSFNKLNSLIKIVNETRDNLNKNINARMTFNMMLLNMLEV